MVVFSYLRLPVICYGRDCFQLPAITWPYLSTGLHSQWTRCATNSSKNNWHRWNSIHPSWTKFWVSETLVSSKQLSTKGVFHIPLLNPMRDLVLSDYFVLITNPGIFRRYWCWKRYVVAIRLSRLVIEGLARSLASLSYLLSPVVWDYFWMVMRLELG